MNKEKMKWLIVLILAVSSLIGYGLYNQNVVLGEKIDTDKLELRVSNYISQVNPGLEVSDIFIYSDSDYYFSIEEEATGKGAMELLVNPYTGSIRPEQGPNMMWNQKYGMHSSGMMSGYSYYNDENIDATTISRDEALIYANEYIQNNLNTNLGVTGEGHEFYGYFTFHIYDQGNTVGMLSVNAYTGEIWYHNWHGTLIEVISEHNEIHND